PTNAPGRTGTDPDATLDWRGLLLASAGTLCLLNGLVNLSRGDHASAWLLLASSVAALAGFVALQRHMLPRWHQSGGTAPLMNPNLFADRRFAMGSIV